MDDKPTLTLTKTAKKIGCSVRTLERMIKDGRFPVKPIKNTKPRRWNSNDVEAWMGRK